LCGLSSASAEAGITVPSDVMFVSGFYSGGHVGCYTDGLDELCHKCMNYVHKRLIDFINVYHIKIHNYIRNISKIYVPSRR